MLPNGTYFIASLLARQTSAAVLDVPEGRSEDGLGIIQYGWHGGANQQWQLTNVGSNYYIIVNVKTGKALDVPYGQPISGVIIQQYTLHRGINQQWRIETVPAITGELSRPEFHRIYSVATGFAIDVPYGSLSWGVKVQQYPAHNGLNQAWVMGNPEHFPYP